MARDQWTCTESNCNQPAVEVHHLFPGPMVNVPDNELAAVCYRHNPRGG